MNRRRMFFVGAIAIIALAIAAGFLIKLNQPISYFACYYQGSNDNWVVFKPHYEYGQKLYALKWSDPNAQPFLLSQSDATGQWEELSQNSAYVAIAQEFKDKSSQVVVYSLEDKKQVAVYLTGDAPLVESFTADNLVFVAYDGEETTPQLRSVNTKDWTVQIVPYGKQYPQTAIIIPQNVQDIIRKKVNYCQSWH